MAALDAVFQQPNRRRPDRGLMTPQKRSQTGGHPIKAPSPAEGSDAFSAIEVIVVLVLIGIVSVAIINRVYDNQNNLIARAEVIKVQLRYAQSKAMNSNVVWGIGSDGAAYWLFKNKNAADKVQLPGESADTITLSSIGLSSLEVFTISFDDKGTPYTQAAPTPGHRLKTGDAQERITVGEDGTTVDIIITPYTGFIP